MKPVTELDYKSVKRSFSELPTQHVSRYYKSSSARRWFCMLWGRTIL